MCAIYGIIKRNILDATDINWVKVAKDEMICRGPDHQNYWISEDNKIILGNNRLMIVNKDESSNQPFHSSNNEYHITFNGAIYNYKNLSKQYNIKSKSNLEISDTEVIVELFSQLKMESIFKLDGQFAIGLYDQLENEFILSRDFAGEKPLYFYFDENLLIFSSEMNALLQHPYMEKKLDKKSFNYFIRVGNCERNRTVICEIKKIIPGQTICLDIINWKINTFQTQQKNYNKNNKSTKSIAYYIEKLDEVLRDSIFKTFDTVSTKGVLLSGGLDSSLITAILSEKYKVKTFTAFFTDEDEDRLKANKVSEFCQTDHREVQIRVPDFHELDKISYYFAEPIFESSLIPSSQLFRFIAKDCSVILSGDGADEIFGGYRHYIKNLKILKYKDILQLFNSSSISKFLSKLAPLGGKFYSVINSFENLDSLENIHSNRFLNEKNAQSLIKKDLYVNTISKVYRKDKYLDPINEILMSDYLNLLPNVMLVKSDRMSMMNSVELRAPYLSKKIIEFAFNEVPSDLKINRNEGKYLLKQLAKKYLPNEFISQNKRGFTPPIAIWRDEPIFINYFRKNLLEENHNLFDKNIINKWIELSTKNTVIFERLLVLSLFTKWIKSNNIDTYAKVF